MVEIKIGAFYSVYNQPRATYECLKAFRAHYPDGYRMEFVPYAEVEEHAGLKEAFRLNDLKRPDEQKEGDE